MKKAAINMLKQSYVDLLFVFFAFTLITLAGYISIEHVLERRLLESTKEKLASIDFIIETALSQAEISLTHVYYVLHLKKENNIPEREIIEFMAAISEQIHYHNPDILLGFHGVYGIINGELFNNKNVKTDSWKMLLYSSLYQRAAQTGRAITHIDPDTGEFITTVIRSIKYNNEEIGLLAIDIEVNRLMEYSASVSSAARGHGILLDQNLTLIAHPDKQLMGSTLYDLGGGYEEIYHILQRGENVLAHRITKTNGDSFIVSFTRITNGWYAGKITLQHQFFKDFYIALFILIIFSLLLSSVLIILLRLYRAKTNADKDSKLKSSFLANMSHEIRTPMNAITGMAELLLRGKLSEEARSYAHDIKQAGNNLISIINDILDFSKIEAGRLEINSARYLFSSQINDTVNIVRARLIEKPLRFFTNIDSNIPNCLYGDEVRLRQILLNLLSNAVKYTERGNISLTITIEKQDVVSNSKNAKEPNKRVWLKILVSDTGCGIKPEDLEKLFNDFIQVDIKKHKNIEGTGLGLAITKRLCLAMGGSITAESEYGKGSTFTVILPQGIMGNEPFAVVNDASSKKVLVYERRTVCADSVCWSLKNLNVPHLLVVNSNDFIDALKHEEWYYVFSGYGIYNKIKQEMDNVDFPAEKQPHLALMVEWGLEAHIPGVRFMSLPVHTLFIANTLNGISDNKSFLDTRELNTIRFTLPQVKLLIVDDIPTNLKVAEGLLAPYEAKVDTCTNGAEAIELVKRRDYDLVFMDHMMPEMDGIEAVSIIRDWEQEQIRSSLVPIIALTANTVTGMREMFIKNGFDDFLAKPIDVSKLDELLDYWISGNKKVWGTVVIENTEVKSEDTPIPAIPGLDTKKGLKKTGSVSDNYRKVLSMFCIDAHKRMPLLKKIPTKDGILLFITQVHAIKSASETIGSMEISKQAAALETAGNSGDMEYIEKNLPVFASQLEDLVKNIEAAVDSMLQQAQKSDSIELDDTYISIFKELKDALSRQDAIEVDRVLEEFTKKPLDSKTKEMLDKITNDILVTEYNNAIRLIDELLAAEK